MGHHNHGSSEQLHVHITPYKTYLNVFIALVTLTVLTVVFSKVIHLPGQLSVLVAFAIALVKASLVLAFFMHLKYESNLHRLIFFSGFLFLAILLFFSFGDILTRIPVPGYD